MQVGTVIASNYEAHAKVLARSLAEHHPDTPFTAVLVDGDDETADRLRAQGITVLRVEDLPGVGALDAAQLRTYYDVTELCTALKPLLLTHLLDTDPQGTAVHLDADILVVREIEGLDDAARRAGIVLTPHIRRPIPRDGRTIDEKVLLRAGTFNLGFLAVSAAARPFLRWWWERLAIDAVNDQSGGLFTDQRWVDLVPSLFPHVVVHDPGWNVAYWNLAERPLRRDRDGTLWAGDGLLRFFHASGYDPRRPHLLSSHQGDRPRVLLSEHPALVELLDDYGSALRDAGYADLCEVPYGWHAVEGRPLSRFVRRLYRRAVIEGDAPPPPFVDPGAFLEWLHQPVAASPDGVLTRIERAYWDERIDMHAHFPDPLGRSLNGFAAWCRTTSDPLAVADIGPFLPDDPPRPPARTGAGGRPPAPGIAVAGYLRAELGVGEAARRLLDAATRTGLPVSAIAYDRTEARQQATFAGSEDGRKVDLSVIVVNADQVHRFFAEAAHRLPAGGRRVGLWAWELPDLPPWFDHAFDLVDEVWTMSPFTAQAVEARAPCPVRLMPFPITADAPTDLRRGDLGIPDGPYTFGLAFDVRSVLRRKNPLGLLRAYADAFADDGQHHLVLKVMHGDADPGGMEELRWAAASRGDVSIVDEVWSPGAASAFLQLVDCYASLHRSEGYGLAMAQAMAQDTPVVATGWSGNLAYMEPDDTNLVPVSLVAVGHAPPYPSDGTWAEPDHGAAVEALRAVAADPDAARARARAAGAGVRERFSLDRAAGWLCEQATDASFEIAGA